MIPNKYPARCGECGGRVAAKAGRLDGKRGRRWRVVHLSCGDANGPAVERIVIGGNEYTQNRSGRCIDAPACGCCSL